MFKTILFTDRCCLVYLFMSPESIKRRHLSVSSLNTEESFSIKTNYLDCNYIFLIDLLTNQSEKCNYHDPNFV